MYMYDTLPNFAFLQYTVVVISCIKKREKRRFYFDIHMSSSVAYIQFLVVFLHSVFMSFAFQEDFLLFAEVDAILQILEKVSDRGVLNFLVFLFPS